MISAAFVQSPFSIVFVLCENELKRTSPRSDTRDTVCK